MPSWCGFISAPHRPGNVAGTLWSPTRRPTLVCPLTGACSPPGLHRPTALLTTQSPPDHTNSLAIPRAVCDCYKLDRRRSGRGVAPAGTGREVRPSACSERRAGRRVSPAALCVQRERRRECWAGAAVGGARCFHLALWGRQLFAPQRGPGPWHAGNRRNKARRRKSLSHAMLPSPARPSCGCRFHQGQV